MEQTNRESALEAILFALGEPVEEERLAQALACTSQEAAEACQALAQRYVQTDAGLRLLRMEHRWQMVSAPQYGERIQTLLARKKPDKLSPAALETLALVAYFQPVTRAYVDQIRGVDSSYTVSLLLERDLIEECGRLAVPGRPIQYRTTQTFLRSFGLSNLDELPELPNTTPEDGQLTLEMQAAVERLQAAQTAEGTEEITEEELLQAAREMAQAEEEA